MNDSDKILKQIAELVIEMADELDPLVRATQQHLGQFGGELFLPTATMRADALQLKADALGQACGIERPTRDHEEQPPIRTGFQTKVSR